MSELRYPIGRVDTSRKLSAQDRQDLIAQIRATPLHLKSAVTGLRPEQLDTPYRPGGWTVRQVVHHVADSHINAYVRFRLALTEDVPTIKPYDENRWSRLEDAFKSPIDVSLTILEALHDRWVRLLGTLSAEDFARQYNHPEMGIQSLDQALQMYSWHGRHHTAHITSLRERMQWG